MNKYLGNNINIPISDTHCYSVYFMRVWLYHYVHCYLLQWWWS